ncbi:MAG: amino acid permease [Myxococcota bacterium]
MGWLGTTALAMGGSNQSLFLIGALIIGQGSIRGQGTAAIPLLAVGLVLSWMALPGWTELILMWPNRVGGIAATCGEAFRPYAPVLGNLTGVSYWWGWVPTCGLTALLSASAINQWFLPSVPVPALACGLVSMFTLMNLLGVGHAARAGVVIASASASLAFLSAIIPVAAGTVDWHQAATFKLDAPFPGAFGDLTSIMAGLYLVGFAAPAFEAAACHVGETKDPAKNVPRAMYASATMATLYFVVLPVIWLGSIGAEGLSGDLAIGLGPTFAPLFGAFGKSLALWFMMFNMFHGTLAPLTGVARTLSQLSEDGLLPEIFAKRNKRDCPWVAIVITAGFAIFFLLIGDPVWLVAAANFTYLIGIALPSVAVWLLRRDQPKMHRPYRAPRGTIVLGLIAAAVWGISTVLGFQQFGLPTVILGLVLAYSGAALYAWRKWSDRRKAGLKGAPRSLHVKLTGAMLLVLVLDGAGYLMAVSLVNGELTAVVAALEDIFVAVAMLTISVGLVLPGTIAHSAVQLAQAADRLATGTLADFSRAMRALASGDLDGAYARADLATVRVQSNDEVGQMAASFNTMQEEIARAAQALDGARDGLRSARDELTEINAHLEGRVVERTAQLETAHRKLVLAARKAGMAEVAIGIVHNVGNVLNSLNVSSTLVDEKLRRSKIAKLAATVELIEKHGPDLASFFADDPKGREVPKYLKRICEVIGREHEEALKEVQALTRSVDHLKQIVSSQQMYASAASSGMSLTEPVDPAGLMDEALRMVVEGQPSAEVEIVRRYTDCGEVIIDKHQTLQILVNLLSNALRAVAPANERRLTLSVERAPEASELVRWSVEDTGVGIRPEVLDRIFEYGFTTKPDQKGGFGLHTAAISAKTMGGSLAASSAGEGAGARFTLELPGLPGRRSDAPKKEAA